jgi:hypothetical protein
MRLIRRRRHSCHREANPVLALRIDDEHLSVEVEQGIEARVALRRHV